MNRERDALKAGLFIVVTIAAIVTIVLAIKGFGRVIEPMEDRQARFALGLDLSGLRAGDDVRLGGYKVGIVKSINVVSGSDNAPEKAPDKAADNAAAEPYILITFSLPQRYRLHKDSQVRVGGTLTGVTWLNIERLGNDTEVMLAEGLPNPTSAFLASLGEMTPDLRTIVGDVRVKTIPKVNNAVDKATGLIQHVDAKIDPVVERYNTVTERAGQALGEVRDTFGDTKTDIRGTMKNLNAATGSIKDKLPALLDQLHTTLESTTVALEDVKKTLANTRDITTSGRSLIVGNHTKLESIISSLKATSDNLKGASVEVRRSPWRLLYKPEPQEMGNLNIYDSARQFAEGAGSLSDAAGALRDAMHDPSANKDAIQKLIEKLDDTFTNFKTVENKLWTTVKE